MENKALNQEQAVENVVKDKAFLTSAIQMDMKSAQKAFADRGVILSDDDMIAIRDLATAQIGKQISGKKPLPEQTLNEIGGGKGKNKRDVTKTIRNISLAIAGIAIVGSLTTLGYKDYKTHKALGGTAKDAKRSLQEAADSIGQASEAVTGMEPHIENLKEGISDLSARINAIGETYQNAPKKSWIAWGAHKLIDWFS